MELSLLNKMNEVIASAIAVLTGVLSWSKSTHTLSFPVRFDLIASFSYLDSDV